MMSSSQVEVIFYLPTKAQVVLFNLDRQLPVGVNDSQFDKNSNVFLLEYVLECKLTKNVTLITEKIEGKQKSFSKPLKNSIFAL